VVVPPTAEIPEPLRLPRGSVRGLIALIVTSTYAYLLLRGISVPSVLINSAVVVIAFYFGTRAAAGPPTPGAQGQPATAAAHTPRRTRVVRGILLLAFLGVAAWFLRSNPSWDGLPPELRSVLEVLGGYVAGLTVSWLIHRRAHETTSRRRIATIARDLLAAGALVLTAYTCFALATGQATVFAERVADALSLVVTFYFGSRVIGH
jgi:hypothetical protein